MKEFKVGEKITLEVIEQIGCSGCFFFDKGSCYSPFMSDRTEIFTCESYERSDGKNVIFKEIKENKKR